MSRSFFLFFNIFLLVLIQSSSNFSSCLSDRGIFISYYLIYSLWQFFTGRQWWWWMFPIKPRSSHSLARFLETTRLPTHMQFFTFSFWVFPVSRLQDTENAKQPRDCVCLRRRQQNTDQWLRDVLESHWQNWHDAATELHHFHLFRRLIISEGRPNNKMWKAAAAAAASASTPIGRINSGTKTL